MKSLLRPRVWGRLTVAIAASLVMAGWSADALTADGRYRFLGRPARDLVLIDPLPPSHHCCMQIYTSWILTTTSYELYDIEDPTEEGVRPGSVPDWIRQIAWGNAIDTVRTDIGWPLRFARVERTSENWMWEYPPPTIHGLLRIGPIPFATRPLFPGFLLLVALVCGLLLVAERALCIPHIMRVRRWRRCGCCVECGYDLVGTHGAVCPECGVTHA